MGHDPQDAQRYEVDRSPEAIGAEMVHTRSALTEKLEALEDRVTTKIDAAKARVESVQESVRSAVRTVKRSFDLPYQVERHPWSMFGASVAAGLILGTVTGGRPNGSEWRGSGRNRRSASGESAGESLVGPEGSRRNAVSDRFGEELHFLRRTAVGAVMSLVRSALKQSFPGVAPQTDQVMDGLTRKLGGEPVGPLFGSQ